MLTYIPYSLIFPFLNGLALDFKDNNRSYISKLGMDSDQPIQRRCPISSLNSVHDMYIKYLLCIRYVLNYSKVFPES